MFEMFKLISVPAIRWSGIGAARRRGFLRSTDCIGITLAYHSDSELMLQDSSAG
jgi:hypothetical protein